MDWHSATSDSVASRMIIGESPGPRKLGMVTPSAPVGKTLAGKPCFRNLAGPSRPELKYLLIFRRTGWHRGRKERRVETTGKRAGSHCCSRAAGLGGRRQRTVPR